jgi:hypothetical protein
VEDDVEKLDDDIKPIDTQPKQTHTTNTTKITIRIRPNTSSGEPLLDPEL